MGQMRKVGSHKTTVSNVDGVITTTYHNTPVCTIDTNTREITLRNGGWFTATTRVRITQTITEYLGLGARVGVFQKNYEWFVYSWDDTFDWYEGITVDY